MRLSKAGPLLFFILTCFSFVEITDAQAVASPLRPRGSVERRIARGETHSFSVSLEPKQFLKLVVEQRGVDIVVRVFSPDGKRLGEFDSPNGTSGPEGVSLIADDAG